jgi:hypothetical protein
MTSLLSYYENQTFAFDCPKMPEQANKDWEVQVNAAVLKLGPIKGAEFKTKVNNTVNDLLGKFPDADWVYLEQMMFSAYCTALRDNKSIKESEKPKLLKEYADEVRKTIEKKSAPPRKPTERGTEKSMKEGSQFVTQKYPSSKQIIYEILSTSHHKKNGLFDLARSERLNYFDLKLDDPILTDYYLIKVRLQNRGVAITEPLKFIISIGEPNTKILDIKYKIIKPTNKSLKITNSLPSLTWEIKEEDCFKFALDPIPEGLAGFNVYGAILKDVGYGRVNQRIVTQSEFEDPILCFKNLSTFYYRVTSISPDGSESDLSEPLPFPKSLALLPNFKDVYIVDPNTPPQQVADGSRKAPFTSISEAMKKVGTSATFIIRQNRARVINSEHLSSSARVFYENDLDFLKGHAYVTLLNGIDENADIQLFFLCKTLLDGTIGVKVNLEGSPEIKVEKLGRKALQSVQSVQKSNFPNDPKALLTPKIVKTYLGENTIYLIWEKPHSPEYKGVKIFRSDKRNSFDSTDFGKELYDGQGENGTLVCNIFQKNIDPEKLADRIRNADDKMANLRPISPHAPSAPTLIGVGGDFEVVGQIFKDKTISPGVAYTYTFFAYDGNKNYSYPIFINASLSDWSKESNCHPNR